MKKTAITSTIQPLSGDKPANLAVLSEKLDRLYKELDDFQKIGNQFFNTKISQQSNQEEKI